MIKVGIIGTRRRNWARDSFAVRSAFLDLHEKKPQEEYHIVSGGCPKGGDHFADLTAKELGLPITIYYPNWNKHGRGAGFVRNGKIAEDSDVLIACVAEDRKGGTEDTIEKFLKKMVCSEKRAIESGWLILV